MAEKTGKTIEQIRTEKGPIRQIAMDLPCRQAGLTNPEIGRIFGVDYSSLSQERKRLRLHLEKGKKLRTLLASLEREVTRLRSDPQWVFWSDQGIENVLKVLFHYRLNASKLKEPNRVLLS